MFDNLIINSSLSINSFFRKLNIDIIYSTPQIKNILAFVIAMMLKGYKGKISDVYELTYHRNRTAIGKFINNSPWDEALLTKEIQQHTIKRIWQLSMSTKQPIYVIIDDTVNEKTVPSSKAQNIIEGCSFHSSHLKHKIVYGHQFVTVMLRCGNTVLPFDIILYDKNADSKIKIAEKVIKALPKPVYQGYVLTDSWYSCKDLFKAASDKGYNYLGALKTNRKIFPRGYKAKGISISKYVKTLNKSDFSLVTAGGKTYYTYTYLGKINGSSKVKIVISYPKDTLWNPKAMKCFISLDIKMNSKQLLNHYIKRWPIETFFRESKRQLGFDKYQIRTLQGIKRYMCLVMLTYVYCELEVERGTLGFSHGMKHIRKEFKILEITHIYNETKKGVSLNDILKKRKFA